MVVLTGCEGDVLCIVVQTKGPAGAAIPVGPFKINLITIYRKNSDCPGFFAGYKKVLCNNRCR